METGARHCSVPKDHIYGILALLDETTRSKIQIDYADSDAVLLTKVMVIALQSHPQFLPFVWEYFEVNTRDIVGLPSWCPDLYHTFAIFHPSEKTYPGFICAEICKRYEPLAQVMCNEDNNVLSCVGLHLDHISRCVDQASTISWDRHLVPDRSLNFVQALQRLFSLCFGAQARQWLSALQSAFPPLHEHESLYPALQAYFSSAHSACERGRPFDLQQLVSCCKDFDSHNVATVNEACERCDISMEQLAEIIKHMYDFLRDHNGKYIFRTGEGKIGWAWTAVPRNGKIIYLPGGNMLHVLSADGNHYVGPAKVEGYMGDWLLNAPIELNDRWETFDLI
jgi:hypothetical protein